MPRISCWPSLRRSGVVQRISKVSIGVRGPAPGGRGLTSMWIPRIQEEVGQARVGGGVGSGGGVPPAAQQTPPVATNPVAAGHAGAGPPVAVAAVTSSPARGRSRSAGGAAKMPREMQLPSYGGAGDSGGAFASASAAAAVDQRSTYDKVHNALEVEQGGVRQPPVLPRGRYSLEEALAALIISEETSKDLAD
eukprot:5991454-Karenia_brevis.AAC.1